MVKIKGIDYQVSILSAGDLPVLSAFVNACQPLIGDFVPGQVPQLTKLLPIGEPLIDLIAHLLDCPRKHVADLALHELIEVTELVATKWTTLNASYLNEHVTPALETLAKALSGSLASEAPETGQEPPQQG